MSPLILLKNAISLLDTLRLCPDMSDACRIQPESLVGWEFVIWLNNYLLCLLLTMIRRGKQVRDSCCTGREIHSCSSYGN